MDPAAAFRRCLIDLDVVLACDLWFHLAPELRQPKNNYEALCTLHYARTGATSIPADLRCYSHAWLDERGLPSALPDWLRPKANRMYPHKVEAVGVAVISLSGENAERAMSIERAMSDAVAECYADGITDCDVIKARMNVARLRVE